MKRKKHILQTSLPHLGLCALLTLAIAGPLYAQRGGGGVFDPGNNDDGEWIGGNNKIYTQGNKVGIGTSTPLRRLHLWGPDAEYLQITSEGGEQFSATVAGLELKRRLDAGQELTWDIVNQGGFKIRRNTHTLFHLQEDDAQLGTQANKLTLNIWGKHIFSNSGQLYDGALALRSSNSGVVSTMRIDGSMIESSGDMYLNWFSDKGVRMAKDGNIRVGPIYSDVAAKLGIKSESWQLSLLNDDKFWKIGVSNEDWAVGEGKLVFSNSVGSSGALMVLTEQGRVGIGMTTPNRTLDIAGSLRANSLEIGREGVETPATLNVNGTTTTKVLEITGGADLAEPFEVTGESAIQPGMVVVIDPVNAGQLKLAKSAYDKTVAGIVSGAGNIQPGMIMRQDNTVASGSFPVALTGRVYCLADAGYGAIQPGDLLTTSGTAGHAMKAGNQIQAQGAIIGKAMTSLDAGRGLVLVLVSLQ